MSGPLPVQVCTWLDVRSGYDGIEPEAGSSEERPEGEWLYCLKGTQPGDRQVIWSGVEGRGIIAVVDFDGAVRRRPDNPQRYHGWGYVTPLARAVPVATAQVHPVLKRYFGRSIQGVESIDAEAAEVISECADGLPPAVDLQDSQPNWADDGGVWSGERLPPEAIVERIVLNERQVAQKLGFRSPVNPRGRRQQLLTKPNPRYPDLWSAEGVVGDAKNQVTARWGPEQLEDYIEQCDLQWPAYRWRGVLVQGEPEMAPNAHRRLKQSRYASRIEVWRVSKGASRTDVARLFP
jgi:hypothetical protein